ncbi:MAG: flagellin [Terracidiphilus sp.]|nr:flagellin [Terracidiphilus sp.]MDR3776941.1 flagellin [Terracidiphilus sp.]
MSLGVLNNINAVYATNNLNNTSSSLSKVLQQLSSGSKINSGADDAAGLSLVDGLAANSAALTQSSTNASEGVGLLQVADGALSQVTSLLNRAVTLATEASNGTLTTTQTDAANQEYQSILSEISNIGSTTTYNGSAVFGSTVNIYTGDSTATGASVDALTISSLDATSSTGSSVGDTGGTIKYTAATTSSAATISYTATAGAALGGTSLTGSTTALAETAAQSALTALNSAIKDVAAQDGYVGAQINTLNSVSSVLTTQQENVQSAQNAVQATDYASATSAMSKYEILSQTGISALAQANSVQQEVTKLLQ